MKSDKRIAIITVAVVLLLLVTAGIGYSVYLGLRAPQPPGSGDSGGISGPGPPPPTDKDANGCYTPSTVRKHYNENACVDYTVGYVYETSAGTQFLDEKTDYSNGFVGYIPYNAQHYNLAELDGKDIQVTGTITEYHGYPEIVITSSNQIKVFQ